MPFRYALVFIAHLMVQPSVGLAAPASNDTPPVAAVLWQGDPIPVRLSVDVERRIDFPEPIADLDVPQSMENHSQIVLTPTGQLHWTAQEVFEPGRVLATSISGTLYQLNVSAQTQAVESNRLSIVDPLLLAASGASSTQVTNQEQQERLAEALIPGFLKGGARSTGSRSGASGPLSYVDLARFALAHYSGPGRLIPAIEAVQVPVKSVIARDWLRIQSRYLEVQPLAQWKLGERYVTAVAVYNKSGQAVEFDPRALRGKPLFVAALHPTLRPAGSGHNGTVWAVVTDQPFNQTVP